MKAALSVTILMSVVACEANVKGYTGSGSVTQGMAKIIEPNIFTCQNGRSRVAGIGEITDANGATWTVPGSNNFNSATKASDLYEQCAGITHKNLANMDR